VIFIGIARYRWKGLTTSVESNQLMFMRPFIVELWS